MNPRTKNVIGIDYGTTFSFVAYLLPQGPRLVGDGDKCATPSVVAYQDGEWLIGKVAARRAPKSPQTTVYDIKRMIGCRFHMPAIQSCLASWPFPVVEGRDGEILVLIEEGDGIHEYHPYELSAKILSKLKTLAKDAIGETVTAAVIAVPTQYTDKQRSEITEAAELAGLTVLSLVDEPTAGAVAYWHERRPAEKKSVLVFDFGGGTLDVSLVDIDGISCTVRAVGGDPHLGGRDIDELLMQLCLDRFDPSGRTTIERLKPRKHHALRVACEDAKCDLSENLRTSVFVEELDGDRDLDLRITREDLEAKCRGLFDRILKPVEAVLEQGHTRKECIDDIILIGGSSAIPAVKSAIERLLGKTPFSGLSPLEAVAKGTAIIAGQLTDGRGSFAFRDICPLSLGIKLSGGVMSVLIEAGAPLPATGSSKFCISLHNQTSGLCEIFEGPWRMTHRNRLLVSFLVEGIPMAEAGEEQVEVTFHLDRSRILTASAVVLSRGTSTHLKVAKFGSLVETAMMIRTEAERERERAIDEQEARDAENTATLRDLITNLETFFDEETTRNSKFATEIPPQMRRAILEFVRDELPERMGGAPSQATVMTVFEQVRKDLDRYLSLHRGHFPPWLAW
jgi:molecular chaperone DnaK (HSP70)